ncbi:helix-turn-helix transcriptional regulator [Micromonospora sp. WMMD998]|uniref:helix-turn-helix domain-containing protein n=1 Tax=Micromonospora sp. WMMD998 TaxID=3016092 RepID=UPI00249C1715|nr:helix-turn-helix transcriptional regulator [Micromonospora sp. WMMD998]WFE41974.1 helix-turn-helix transcriptional regulator [Micromonospora sp. WMMD998]
MSEPTIGDNLRRLRERSTLKQEQLAERAGLSVDLIKKLEQNVRTSARIPTLRKLARALGVDTTALMGSAAQAQAMREPDAEPLGLVGLRQALTPTRGLNGRPVGPRPTIDAGQIALSRVEQMVVDANRAYHRDALAEAITALPHLLATADAVVDYSDGERGRLAHGIASYAYQLAGRLLIQLRQLDLAHVALDTAAGHARAAADQLAGATTAAHLCWLLVRAGRLAEVADLAVRTADQVEPRLSTATPRELAAWGVLLLKGAAAAARDAREDDARDMLDLAGAGAARLGGRLAESDDLADRWFRDVAGNDFCGGGVHLMRVETAVVAGDPGRALALAQAMQGRAAGVTPSSYQRHLLDVAWSHTQEARYADATAVLRGLRQAAPAWLRQQRYARDVVQSIADGRRRAMTAEFAELADWVGCPI